MATEISPALRSHFGWGDKLPHDTTRQKFSARGKVLEIVGDMIRRSYGKIEREPKTAAMDATGLKTTTASAHFQCRRSGERCKWGKLLIIILYCSLPSLGLVTGWGAKARQKN